jgi:hypothetical protein
MITNLVYKLKIITSPPSKLSESSKVQTKPIRNELNF